MCRFFAIFHDDSKKNPAKKGSTVHAFTVNIYENFCDANFLGQTNRRVVQQWILSFDIYVDVIAKLPYLLGHLILFIVLFILFFFALVCMKNKNRSICESVCKKFNQRDVFPHFQVFSMLIRWETSIQHQRYAQQIYKLNANPFFSLPSQWIYFISSRAHAY